MKSFILTIKDITAWTITVRAHDAIRTEERAWKLFDESSDRSEHFETDSDTTVRVEEAGSNVLVTRPDELVSVEMSMMSPDPVTALMSEAFSPQANSSV